ncbi:MAG: carbonic anhydrase [Candidatus Gastranaerophilales bacterium]|nr:carbonic anhydrase [Candidatus Gastranaerophilales bacterium]
MKQLLKILTLGVILASIQLNSLANTKPNISAEEAMQKLINGNDRFVGQKFKHPDQTKERRQELLKGQMPFVAILSCSDSRVPPEIIFDQGLGDIFEIRNAGNVKDDQVIGSIEYAVVHCGVRLIVIMGHQDCGAVKATLSHNKESKYIESLTKDIEPAIDMAKCQKGDFTANVEKDHAILTVKRILAEDKTLKEYIKDEGLKIVPAYYHLDSGKVEFLK